MRGRGGKAVCVSAFPYGAPRQSFSNYPTVDLAALKEITQELAALFGLALPDSICSRQSKTSVTV